MNNNPLPFPYLCSSAHEFAEIFNGLVQLVNVKPTSTHICEKIGVLVKGKNLGAIPVLIEEKKPAKQTSFLSWNNNKEPECSCTSVALFINNFINANREIFFSELAGIFSTQMRINTFQVCVVLERHFKFDPELLETLTNFMLDIDKEFQHRATLTSDLNALQKEIENKQQIVEEVKATAFKQARATAQRTIKKAQKNANEIAQEIIGKAQEEAKQIRIKLQEEQAVVAERIKQEELRLENLEKEKIFLLQIPTCAANLRKFWGNDKLKEIVFRCKEGKEVYAHRLIFCDNPWFDNIMRSTGLSLDKLKCLDSITREMIEIDTEEEGYSKEAVEIVLSYRYGLETFRELSYPLLKEVWDFAHYVRFEDLVEKCEILLIETIQDLQDALPLLGYATTSKLKQHIDDILAQNVQEWTQQEHWPKGLSLVNFVSILENSHLSITEKRLCEAIIEWALFHAHDDGQLDYTVARCMMTNNISNEKPYSLIHLVNFDHVSLSEFDMICAHYDFLLPKPTLGECVTHRQEAVTLAGPSFPLSRLKSWQLVQENPNMATLRFSANIQTLENRNEFISPLFPLGNMMDLLTLKMSWNELNESYDIIMENASVQSEGNSVMVSLSFEEKNQNLSSLELEEGSFDFLITTSTKISKSEGWSLQEIKEWISHNRFTFTLTFLFDQAKADANVKKRLKLNRKIARENIQLQHKLKKVEEEQQEEAKQEARDFEEFLLHRDKFETFLEFQKTVYRLWRSTGH